MPYAARTRCALPGCSAFATAAGRCDTHQRPAWTTRSPRNTTTTWADRAKFRSAVLARDAVCRACGTRPTSVADHITPIADGGSNNPETNGQGLCEVCHGLKTRAENARRNAARAAARRSTQP